MEERCARAEREDEVESMTSDLAWFPIDKCFISGHWVTARSGALLPLEDPSRGIEIGAIARGRSADVDAAVEAAEQALAGDWGRLTATERGRLMTRLGELVRTRVEELARLEALDVGKPIKQARADALAMARYFEFYGGAADKVIGETIPYLRRLHRATRCASRTASPATSCRGTIRCRSSAAPSAPRWRWATPAS